MYKPSQLEIPQLNKFAPDTEKGLTKLITTMPAKTC